MKNCSTCKWAIDDKCENTNWKTGSHINYSLVPECGYMFSNSNTPMGFDPINKKDHHNK